MSKEVIVSAKYLRISSKKTLPWLRMFKGMSIDQARDLCIHNSQKTLKLAHKLIESGVAAAKDQDIEEVDLRIQKIICQQGPTLKRQVIRSRGRTDIISKRTSHFVATLKSIKKPKKKIKTIKKAKIVKKAKVKTKNKS